MVCTFSQIGFGLKDRNNPMCRSPIHDGAIQRKLTRDARRTLPLLADSSTSPGIDFFLSGNSIMMPRSFYFLIFNFKYLPSTDTLNGNFVRTSRRKSPLILSLKFSYRDCVSCAARLGVYFTWNSARNATKHVSPRRESYFPSGRRENRARRFSENVSMREMRMLFGADREWKLVGIARSRFHADRGALPGQGERRRPRTLVIVLFVTEKYNAGSREWVRPAGSSRGRMTTREGGRRKQPRLHCRATNGTDNDFSDLTSIPSRLEPLYPSYVFAVPVT